MYIYILKMFKTLIKYMYNNFINLCYDNKYKEEDIIINSDNYNNIFKKKELDIKIIDINNKNEYDVDLYINNNNIEKKNNYYECDNEYDRILDMEEFYKYD